MFLPLPSWFSLQPPSDLHGLGHTARVMTWASVLTRGTEWFEPVLWAAACHDLRREDDGSDPQHGFRAGSWVRRKLPAELNTPPDHLELVASACDWHVCPDRHAKWDHPVLWLLKDADGLDRVRLYDLDPAYLRRAETRQWIEAATELYEQTDSLDNPLRIWETAADLGLPMDELLEWSRRQVQNLKAPSVK